MISENETIWGKDKEEIDERSQESVVYQETSGILLRQRLFLQRPAR